MFGRAGFGCSLLVLVMASALACGDDDKKDGVASERDDGTRPMLYVGSEGNILWYSLGEADGTLTMKGGLTYPHAATFMTASKDKKFLYGLLRTIDEDKRKAEMLPLEGFVATFAIDQSTGGLTEIARRPSMGDRPTYITLDKTGRFVLVANNLGHLVGNSIVVYPVGADGKLGEPVQKLMTGVRAHQVRVHPNNKFVYVPNIDSHTVSQFTFAEATGQLTPINPPTASVDMMAGPRHLDFHPNGKWVYLSNEYAATVDTFSVGADGALTRQPPAAPGLPADYTMRKWQSEILVAPSGRYVYAGERVHESIAIFAIDDVTGMPSLKGHAMTMGKTPRNFTIDKAGKWMVVGNQESSSLVVFRINAGDGSLTLASGPMPQPTPYAHLFVRLP